jgi:hypothetical protein
MITLKEFKEEMGLTNIPFKKIGKNQREMCTLKVGDLKVQILLAENYDTAEGDSAVFYNEDMDTWVVCKCQIGKGRTL